MQLYPPAEQYIDLVQYGNGDGKHEPCYSIDTKNLPLHEFVGLNKNRYSCQKNR